MDPFSAVRANTHAQNNFASSIQFSFCDGSEALYYGHTDTQTDTRRSDYSTRPTKEVGE